MTAIPTEIAPQATPPTPPTPAPSPITDTAPVTPSEPPTDTFGDGGELGGGEKIQWFAIAIFGLTMLALAYKSIYYNRQIKLIGKSNNDYSKKLAELEKNIRAVRGEKYESTN